MAPSHDSREKRPCAARAFASGRDGSTTKGESLGRGTGATPVAARIFSSSPVPTTASTSGMFFRIWSRNRSTRHPATTNFLTRPEVLCVAISRIVFTDSCCALSINEQVLTTMTSASSARDTNSAPAFVTRPIITSLSTRFFGQPRLTNPTFGAEDLGASGVKKDEVFDDMQSFDHNI